LGPLLALADKESCVNIFMACMWVVLGLCNLGALAMAIYQWHVVKDIPLATLWLVFSIVFHLQANDAWKRANA
jgi:hypothetical protein